MSQCDHLERVILLLLGVLIEQQPFGIAIAAHVDADRGIAMAGEIGMGEGVAHDGAVALAVGQVFEDRRHRLLLCVLRQPQAGGEPDPVRQGNPDILDFLHLAREGGDGLHAGEILSGGV